MSNYAVIHFATIISEDLSECGKKKMKSFFNTKMDIYKEVLFFFCFTKILGEKSFSCMKKWHNSSNYHLN